MTSSSNGKQVLLVHVFRQIVPLADYFIKDKSYWNDRLIIHICSYVTLSPRKNINNEIVSI